MKQKIIAAGHICLDITPVFPAGNTYDQVGEILKAGKLVQVGAADVHTGGSVANTGLAFRKLGADVMLCGKVGKDAFGSMIGELLAENGVTGLLIDETAETSYSVVIAIPGIDRIFIHNPGANNSFCSSDIPDSAIDDAALFHFGYPTLMRKMYENDGKELAEIFERVKKKEIATSLDMAAIDPSSEAGKADWRSILSRVLPFTDFFVPSFEELLFMLNREKYERLISGGGDISAAADIKNDVMPLAEECLKMGCKTVLIKCGTSGMYYRTGDREAVESIGKRFCINVERWADKEGTQPCFKADRVLSATGAGDSSLAAFLYAALRGNDPARCAALAAAEGACAVTEYDALSGLKSLKELEMLVDSGKLRPAAEDS